MPSAYVPPHLRTRGNASVTTPSRGATPASTNTHSGPAPATPAVPAAGSISWAKTAVAPASAKPRADSTGGKVAMKRTTPPKPANNSQVQAKPAVAALKFAPTTNKHKPYQTSYGTARTASLKPTAPRTFIKVEDLPVGAQPASTFYVAGFASRYLTPRERAAAGKDADLHLAFADAIIEDAVESSTPIDREPISSKTSRDVLDSRLREHHADTGKASSVWGNGSAK